MKRKFPTSISKILQENPNKKYLGLGPKNKPGTPASVCTTPHLWIFVLIYPVDLGLHQRGEDVQAFQDQHYQSTLSFYTINLPRDYYVIYICWYAFNMFALFQTSPGVLNIIAVAGVPQEYMC